MRTHLELDCATEVCHHKAPQKDPLQVSPPLAACWSGKAARGTRSRALHSDEGERHRPGPGKQGPSSCVTATICKHLDTYTHTRTHVHTKKDPDSQRRKDMDVLKIAQNPLNLQTSEMVKVPCQETRPLPRNRQQGPSVKWPLGRAPSTVLLRTGRWHAVTGHSALAVACKKWTFRRWTEPRMLITATPPHKETTLYGTKKVGAGAGQAQGQIQQERGSRG